MKKTNPNPLKFGVYIAGSMHGRLGREIIEERDKAKLVCRLNNLTYYDPAEHERVMANKISNLKPDLPLMRRYVSKDDAALDRSKVLLVLTGDKSSAGTGWEMARMHYRNGRPIVLVAPKMYHRLLTNFTTVKAAKVCETVEQAIEWIKGRHV